MFGVSRRGLSCKHERRDGICVLNTLGKNWRAKVVREAGAYRYRTYIESYVRIPEGRGENLLSLV